MFCLYEVQNRLNSPMMIEVSVAVTLGQVLTWAEVDDGRQGAKRDPSRG